MPRQQDEPLNYFVYPYAEIDAKPYAGTDLTATYRDEPAAPQVPRMPDLDAQRAAIKQLAFLVGKWTGEARLFQPSGNPVERIQTEEAQFQT
jgi:hypothetical protein